MSRHCRGAPCIPYTEDANIELALKVFHKAGSGWRGSNDVWMLQYAPTMSATRPTDAELEHAHDEFARAYYAYVAKRR